MNNVPKVLNINEAAAMRTAYQNSEAEINQCIYFAASRLRVKPDPVESHAKP